MRSFPLPLPGTAGVNAGKDERHLRGISLGIYARDVPHFRALMEKQNGVAQVPHEAWLDQLPAAKSNRAKSADTKAAEIQRISAALACPGGIPFPVFWPTACLKRKRARLAAVGSVHPELGLYSR